MAGDHQANDDLATVHRESRCDLPCQYAGYQGIGLLHEARWFAVLVQYAPRRRQGDLQLQEAVRGRPSSRRQGRGH